jgi:hypothetical protein
MIVAILYREEKWFVAQWRNIVVQKSVDKKKLKNKNKKRIKRYKIKSNSDHDVHTENNFTSMILDYL